MDGYFSTITILIKGHIEYIYIYIFMILTIYVIILEAKIVI